MKFLGELFGVEITERVDGYSGMMVQLLSEDDGNWFEDGSRFSDGWLDDLIEVLQQAKAYKIRRECTDDT